VRPGDVVVAAGGQRVDGAQALRNIEGLLPVDQAVSVELQRGDRRLTVQAVLKAKAREIDGQQIDPRLTGATLTELPERLRQQGLEGVIASKVDPQSRAARSGLRAGDFIALLNGRKIDDLAAFRAGFGERPRELVLGVARGNRQGYLVMQ
jgi:S1-C subfamily serine protease